MSKNETELKVMWGLCAGLGGAEQAFEDSPNWLVVRIDNNPILLDHGVENLEILDVLNWASWVPGVIEKYGVPDLIIAGPPCLEFSNGYSGPKMRHHREHGGLENYEPDMSLVWACQDLIQFVNPQWWIVENVAGACPYFDEVFGTLEQKISGFVLWGRFPQLILPTGWTHSKFENDTWSSDPLRANRRAKWPLEISQAVLTAIESQSTLWDF